MSRTRDKDGGWAWVVLCACSVCVFMTSGLAMLAGIFQKVFLEDFGGDVVMTSWITSLFASFMQLTGPVTGVVVSVFSCRVSVMVGAGLLTAGLLVSAFCESPTALLLSFGLSSGLGLGLIYSAAIVMVNVWFVRYRPVAVGSVLGAGGLGIMAMPVLCQFLLASHSSRHALAIMAALSAQLLVAGALLFPVHESSGSDRGTCWKIFSRCFSDRSHAAEDVRETKMTSRKPRPLVESCSPLEGSRHSGSQQNHFDQGEGVQYCAEGASECDQEGRESDRKAGCQTVNELTSSHCTVRGETEVDHRLRRNSDVVADRDAQNYVTSGRSDVEDAREKDYLLRNSDTVEHHDTQKQVTSCDSDVEDTKEADHLLKNSEIVEHHEPRQHVTSCDSEVENTSEVDHLLSNSDLVVDRESSHQNQTVSSQNNAGHTAEKQENANLLPSPVKTKPPSSPDKPTQSNSMRNTDPAFLASSSESIQRRQKPASERNMLSRTADLASSIESIKRRHNPVSEKQKSQKPSSEGRSMLSSTKDVAFLASSVDSIQRKQKPASERRSMLSSTIDLAFLASSAESLQRKRAKNPGSKLPDSKLQDSKLTESKLQESKLSGSKLQESKLSESTGTAQKLARVLREPSLVLMCLELFLANAALGIVLVHFPEFCVQRGSDLRTVSFSFSMNGVTLTLSRFLMGCLAQDSHMDPLAVYVGMALLTSLFMAVTPVLAVTSSAQIALMGLLGIYFGGSYSLLTEITIHCAGVDTLSLAFGMEMISAGLGFLVAPPIAGWLIVVTGSYSNAMLLAGFLNFLGAFVAMTISLTRPVWKPTDTSDVIEAYVIRSADDVTITSTSKPQDSDVMNV